MRLSMQCDSGGARARSAERALGLTPFSQSQATGRIPFGRLGGRSLGAPPGGRKVIGAECAPQFAGFRVVGCPFFRGHRTSGKTGRRLRLGLRAHIQVVDALRGSGFVARWAPSEDKAHRLMLKATR